MDNARQVVWIIGFLYHIGAAITLAAYYVHYAEKWLFNPDRNHYHGSWYLVIPFGAVVIVVGNIIALLSPLADWLIRDPNRVWILMAIDTFLLYAAITLKTQINFWKNP